VVIDPTPVDPAVPAPGPAPDSSVLPPPLPAELATNPRLSPVRTSPRCDHGAVVSVTPHDGAYRYQAVRARDGATAGLGRRSISELPGARAARALSRSRAAEPDRRGQQEPLQANAREWYSVRKAEIHERMLAGERP
jgi:hypothetical protein